MILVAASSTATSTPSMYCGEMPRSIARARTNVRMAASDSGSARTRHIASLFKSCPLVGPSIRFAQMAGSLLQILEEFALHHFGDLAVLAIFVDLDTQLVHLLPAALDARPG